MDTLNPVFIWHTFRVWPKLPNIISINDYYTIVNRNLWNVNKIFRFFTKYLFCNSNKLCRTHIYLIFIVEEIWEKSKYNYKLTWTSLPCFDKVVLNWNLDADICRCYLYKIIVWPNNTMVLYSTIGGWSASIKPERILNEIHDNWFSLVWIELNVI